MLVFRHFGMSMKYDGLQFRCALEQCCGVKRSGSTSSPLFGVDSTWASKNDNLPPESSRFGDAGII